MQIIGLLFHIGVVFALALSEGEHDARTIMRGAYIDHVRGWLVRASFMVLCGAAVISIFGAFTLQVVLGMSLISAFGFSALFRYRLNKVRSLSPYYVSPSNYYDRFFISITNIGAVKDEEYDINSAGRVAYITEGVLFTVGVVLTFC